MSTSASIGVTYGVPDGEKVRVEHDECLASESGIPQIGVAFGIGADTTSDNDVLIDGYKEAAVTGSNESTEETVVWNIAFGFEEIVLTKEFATGLQLCFSFCFAGDDTFGVCRFDAVEHFFR